MAFRESAEREVLLQQENEYAAELETLEKQVETLDAPDDADLRIEALTLERDRLKREIIELREKRDNAFEKWTDRQPKETPAVILEAEKVFRYMFGAVAVLILVAFIVSELVRLIHWVLHLF